MYIYTTSSLCVVVFRNCTHIPHRASGSSFSILDVSNYTMSTCGRLNDRGRCKYGCNQQYRVCHFWAKGHRCKFGANCFSVHEFPGSRSHRQRTRSPHRSDSPSQYEKDLAFFGLADTPIRPLNINMVKKMYTVHALDDHPDKASEEEKSDANRKFQELGAAYERLKQRFAQ